MKDPKNPLRSPWKVALLLLLWVAATVVMQLLTESRWWLAAIGGAGVVALVLSFTLPDEKKAESA